MEGSCWQLLGVAGNAAPKYLAGDAGHYQKLMLVLGLDSDYRSSVALAKPIRTVHSPQRTSKSKRQ